MLQQPRRLLQQQPHKKVGSEMQVEAATKQAGVGVGSKAAASAQVHETVALCWVKYETEGYTDQDNAEKSYFERSKKILHFTSSLNTKRSLSE